MSTNRPAVLTLKQFKALVAKGEKPENVMLLKDHNAGRFAVDPQKRQASVIVSTASVDRDRDIIKLEGWDLDEYRKNPVVLFGHKAEDLPVGSALDIATKGGALRSVMKFPEPGVYPFADTVYGLVKADFLRTVSAGFRPLEFEPDEARGGMNFHKQKLVEYSIVPIPSNPEALIEAKAQGIPTDALVEWCVKMLDSASDEPLILVPKSKVEKALAMLDTKRSVFMGLPAVAEPVMLKMAGLLTMEQGEALLEAVQQLEETLAEIGLSSTADADAGAGVDPVKRPKENDPEQAKNPPENGEDGPAEALPEGEAGPEKQPGEGDPNMPEEDGKKKPWPPKKDDAAQVTKAIARVQMRAGMYCVVLPDGEVVHQFDKEEPALRLAESLNSAARAASKVGQGDEPKGGDVVLTIKDDAAPVDKGGEVVYHVDDSQLHALISGSVKRVTDEFKLKVLGQLPD